MARPTQPHASQLDWTHSELTEWVDTVPSVGELVPEPWTDQIFDEDSGNYRKRIKTSSAISPSRWYERDHTGDDPARGTIAIAVETVDRNYLLNGGKSYPATHQQDTASWGTVDGWVPIYTQDGSVPFLQRVPVQWTDGAGGMKPGYMTVGELFLYRKLNGEPTLVPDPGPGDETDPDPDPDPDPEPDPEPEPGDTAAAVLQFAGIPATPELLATTQSHVDSVTLQVRAYTRRGGFDADTGEPVDDVRAVIVSATARSVSNPTGHARIALGTASFTPGTYSGWTLPELAILNSYRKRWA